MKRIILLSVFVFSFLYSQAQWVSIPDSNFGKWLTTEYPICMQGNPQIGFQMDTSCNAIISIDSLDCYYEFIKSIEGIQYFKSLTYLDCGSNQLSNLPALSNILVYLDCSNNQLSNLLPFSNSLTYLNCSSNKIGSLPNIPSTMRGINCSYNKLVNLPNLPNMLEWFNCSNNLFMSLQSLPSSLKYLECSGNQLSVLPNLPLGLTFLGCSNLQLTSLPSLPNLITYLNCSFNQIASLPSLPNQLVNFNCARNQLSSLPFLPNSLEDLYCEYNLLSNLPTLPTLLKNLDCSFNILSSVPSLPTLLTSLGCSHNRISSLPILPNSLTRLYCDSNQIVSLPTLPITLNDLFCTYNSNLGCLPNKIIGLNVFHFIGTNIQCMPNRFPCMFFDINPNTLPLCDLFSECNFNYNITGNTFKKSTSSCSQDSLNPGTGLSNIKLHLEQNGQTVQQTYTYHLGDYSFDTDSNTAYTIRVDTTGLPFAVACPVSKERNVLLTNMDSVKYNQDFGLECQGFDVGVVSMQSRFRAGQLSAIKILAGDMLKQVYKANCATNIAGTVSTTISGSASYVSPTLGALTPSSVLGNTLSYTITDFSALNPNAFNIEVATDTQAQIGTNICISVVVTTTATDINVANNSMTQCFPVVNSYDPNVKEVSPTASATSGDWLTYTVHFQNTGNDTAYDVTVRDTLSSLLDVESFQFLASSHEKHVIQLRGNAIAFSFPNINLVDSATNPTGSQGWFQFRVKSKKNLPLNTAIDNTAFIYFDFNPAIKTNTATFRVEALGISFFSTEAKINLYPNPNQGSFSLLAPSQIGKEWQISDMIGRNIENGIVQSEMQYIQLENATKGVYLFSCGGQQIRVIVQ